MTRCLHALSLDQNLQDELRLEFAEAKLLHGDGDFDHETLQSLPLLDAVIKESLRLSVPLSCYRLCLMPIPALRLFPLCCASMIYPCPFVSTVISHHPS